MKIPIAGFVTLVLAAPMVGCADPPAPTPPAEACVVRVANPSLPDLHNDLLIAGHGSLAQCSNGSGLAPAGGTVTVIAAPQGQQMCSVNWKGLTITEYSNDPASGQSGCAWMRQQAGSG